MSNPDQERQGRIDRLRERQGEVESLLMAARLIEGRAGTRGQNPEQRRAEIRRKNRRIKAVAILAGAAGAAWAWITRHPVATAAIGVGTVLSIAGILALQGAGPSHRPEADAPTTTTGPVMPTMAMPNPPAMAPTIGPTTAPPGMEPTTTAPVPGTEPPVMTTGPAAQPTTVVPTTSAPPSTEPPAGPTAEPTGDPTTEPPTEPTNPPPEAGDDRACLIDLNLGIIRVCL